MKLFKTVLNDPLAESEAAVVIDVCRAFTTAAFAFFAGAEKIFLVRTVQEAFKLKDDVPIKEKKRREAILTEILRKTALEKNKKFIGKTAEALIENSDGKYLFGKTWHYKTVKFEGPKDLVGQFINIKITDATSWGLTGEFLI